MIIVARADLTAEASRALIESLNHELRALYPEPGATHFQLDPEEVTGGRGTFLIVYRAGSPAGCGALRLLDAKTAELKRMYVAPAVRGTGLGRRLVTALEAEARALGVRRLVLETGTAQPEAIALYESAGYTEVPKFGIYRCHDGSRCYGKAL